MNSKLSASRRASRRLVARGTTLLLVIASVGVSCSVYDESLRQGAGLTPTAGNAAGGSSAATGAGAGGADTSGGGAGASLAGELVDAGAAGVGGDGGEPPQAGASNAGSSNAGSANTGGSSAGSSGAAGAGAGGVATAAGAGGTLANAGSGGSSAGTAGVGGQGTELVVGKPTTASTAQPANPSASGNDGQTTTRWSATTAALPQWWRVDLGASHALTQVSLQFEFADRKYTYAVEASMDDVSYTVQGNVLDGIGALQTVSIPNHAAARYVRITCTATVPGTDPATGASRPTWASLKEVSVLGI